MAQAASLRQTPDDSWTVVRLTPGQCPASFILPDTGALFPLALWLARKQEIICRYKRIGLWLENGDEIDAIAGDLHYFQAIAIDFAGAVDVRGCSAARLLRERYRFEGELRALGNVQPDQLFYLKRCGFDSFAQDADTGEAAADASAVLPRLPGADAGQPPIARSATRAPVIDLAAYRRAAGGSPNAPQPPSQSCMARQ